MPSMLITVTTPTCMFCGRSEVIEVDATRYARWMAGAFVQDVWPEWSPGEREMLITGTHPKCWDDNLRDDVCPDCGEPGMDVNVPCACFRATD